MSRTHRYTSPDVSRRRRAVRTAIRQIKEAWAFTGWMSGRRYRGRGPEMARAFQADMRSRTGEDFWAAVANVRPWLPRRRR